MSATNLEHSKVTETTTTTTTVSPDLTKTVQEIVRTVEFE